MLTPRVLLWAGGKKDLTLPEIRKATVGQV